MNPAFLTPPPSLPHLPGRLNPKPPTKPPHPTRLHPRVCLALPKRKEPVRDMYDARAPVYHDAGVSGFHGALCAELINAAAPPVGGAVLDLCAGTGIVSAAAADAVGPAGVVVALDFAHQMVREGRRRAAEAALDARLRFVVGDVEREGDVEAALAASGRRAFDAMYCSAAVVWLDSLPAALEMWRRRLAAGGLVAFNGWSADSFVLGAILQDVAWARGWNQVPDWHGQTATPELCERLVLDAGFDHAEVHVKDMSRTRVAADLKACFDSLLAGTPSKQDDRLFLKDLFNEEEKEVLRQAYCERVDEMADGEGLVVDKVLTHTVVGRVA